MFQPRTGIYVSGTVGAAAEYDITANDLTNSSNEVSFDVDSHSTYTGAIGAYIGPARIEFEVGFREPDVTDFTGITGFEIDGTLEYLTFMGNVYYDFPTPVDGLDLYLGAGAGLAIMTGDFTFDPPVTVGGGFISATTGKFDDTFQTFAYQFMAGASYRLVDNVTVFGGYRIRLFTETNEENSLLIFREHDVNSLEVGLRIDF